VELAYARHYLAREGGRPAYGVLHLFGFLLAVSNEGSQRFIEELTRHWQHAAPATRFGYIVAVARLYWHLLASAWWIGPWLRRELSKHPGAPVFLVVSHHHLTRDHTLGRIRRSLALKTVCLIHDLIPLEYPEYFEPGWERRYRRLSRNIGHFFDAVIANSESTARALRDCLVHGDSSKPNRVAIRTVALGVDPFPRHELAQPAAQPQAPYFAVLGTIEPRKNHLLLLNLWTRIATLSQTPPRLVVIGSRGWENEQVVDMLERSRRLRGLVQEYNGLADAEVGTLLANCCALLLPSFAEGYGLPLAEALASGVPALCSDLPALREIGRDVPEYLDPLDLHSWLDAVLDYARLDSPRRAAQLERLARWRTPRWAEHFGVVEQLLDGLQSVPVSLATQAAQSV
jgi:glycosyltransferase involved in cell wall biosynthesis